MSAQPPTNGPEPPSFVKRGTPLSRKESADIRKHVKRAAGSRPSGWRTFGKILLWILFIGLLGGGAAAGYVLLKADQAIRTVGTDASVPADKADKPFAMLLLGMDTRKATGSLNTDVIIVAAFNPERKTATLVSIPRDTYMTVKVKGLRQNKANAYYANFKLGEQSKGQAEKEMKDLFSKYLDVPISYIGSVDFSGFAAIVDRLGGLTLTVDSDMCYRDNYDKTDIRLSKGLQHLDGEQTLNFVRYRHSNCRPATPESNDIERNERQSMVLREIQGRMLSLGSLTRLGPVIEAAGEHVKTDMPSEQIRRLLMTYLLAGRDNMNYVHLAGKWQSPYITIDEEELKQAKDALKQELKEE
ncbi:LCP family protein [Paenibacillus sp. y28]|uniref:LCP family protein n=1 Tax=Paenibacillus sp. y28 TaxID=3129110 RepID=UPI003017DF65